MKLKLSAAVAVVTLATALVGCNKEANKEVALETDDAKVSYGIGKQIGSRLPRGGQDLNVDAIALGISDAINQKDDRLTEEVIRAAFESFEKKMESKQEVENKSNVDEGKNYLAENAKKEGVVTLPSGLQYKVLKAGNGASPQATDTVVTHYEGKLIDGTVFDSSISRGTPAEFPVNRVIPGWTEALQLMKEGDKWELYIPNELAYGSQARGPKLPAYSTLVFNVELLEVKGATEEEHMHGEGEEGHAH